ncbi:MAG: O-antigen ligase family protein, partial [Terriglobales bacterium]
DKTANARVNLWKHSLRMFVEHPILGVGPGNFSATRASQNLSETVAHSIYFEVLAEYGLAGTLSVALTVFAFFLLNAQTRRQLLARETEAQRRFEYCLSYGLDLAMVGFLMSGAFASVLLYPHLWILAAFAVGLNGASRQPAAPVDASQRA